MKRLACIILIVTILVSGLFFVETAYAQIPAGITISSNEEWTISQSPVNFNGTVTVASGVTLTIDPGVTVNLGMYSLLVYGTLIAQGNSSSQIVFAATVNVNSGNLTLQNNLVVPIIFSSLNAVTSSGSIIQNAILDGVYLAIDGASPEIDNCLFNFATGVSPISINGGSPVISNNTINFNAQSIQGFGGGVDGINVFGGSPLIASNQFEGDFLGYSNIGIYVSSEVSGTPIINNNSFVAQYGNNSEGISVVSGSPQITNNQFEGGGYLNGIIDSSSSYITISNNTFSNCLSGITAQAQSTLTVQGNFFLRGTDGIDIISGAASLTITDNLIDSNSRYGINGGGSITSNTISNNQIGIHNPPSGVISYNNIVGNSINSVTATVDNIDAANNWWGITDTATINRTIYDSKVDCHLGTVTFTPFLTQPSTSAPTIPSYTPTITPVPSPVPPSTLTDEPVLAPTSTSDQDSPSFVNQVGTLLNLNVITTVTAIVLVIVWMIVILGYAAKRGISKYR